MGDEGTLTRLADQPVGGLVLVHGQGDHSRRHLATIEALSAVGITVVAPDLPGHGRSEGKRGHIRGMGDVDQIIGEASERLRELVPGRSCGIAGHSMGGLLVADYFARGHGDCFEWVWLSSALIDAGHGKPAWLQSVGRLMAKVWPSFTISTGVRPGDSGDGGADPERIARERASGTHNRISVGWGSELLRASQRVSEAASTLFGERPVLMTHGDADRVCPMRYTKALFENLPSADKEFVVVPSARHEPWSDPAVVAKVCEWIAVRARNATVESGH